MQAVPTGNKQLKLTLINNYFIFDWLMFSG